jgi:hypothetical protein
LIVQGKHVSKFLIIRFSHLNWTITGSKASGVQTRARAKKHSKGFDKAVRQWGESIVLQVRATGAALDARAKPVYPAVFQNQGESQ